MQFATDIPIDEEVGRFDDSPHLHGVMADDPNAPEPTVHHRAPDKPLFTDLGPFLDGTAKHEVPTIAEALPGKFLF